MTWSSKGIRTTEPIEIEDDEARGTGGRVPAAVGATTPVIVGPGDSGPHGPCTIHHNNDKESKIMLKVNVGLSRKLSKDYNSEGLLHQPRGGGPAPVNDPQAVVEQIKEL